MTRTKRMHSDGNAPRPLVLLAFVVCVLCGQARAFCCNYGKTQSAAAKSCADIARQAPNCIGDSGMYWIEDQSGNPVQVYCNMVDHGGGWERVAYYDSTQQSSTVCPGNMHTYDIANHRLCTNNDTNITEAEYYPVVGKYSEVLGLMIGYASDDGDGFRPNGQLVLNLTDVYMDGLSLCINDSNDIIKHVFSFAVSSTDDINQPTNCFLYSGSIASPPNVLGKDNLCFLQLSIQYLNLDGTFSTTTAPFGDRDEGACEFVALACRHPGRYFYKRLPNDYTSSDEPLLLRVMSQGGTVIAMSFIDIYVR